MTTGRSEAGDRLPAPADKHQRVTQPADTATPSSTTSGAGTGGADSPGGPTDVTTAETSASGKPADPAPGTDQTTGTGGTKADEGTAAGKTQADDMAKPTSGTQADGTAKPTSGTRADGATSPAGTSGADATTSPASGDKADATKTDATKVDGTPPVIAETKAGTAGETKSDRWAAFGPAPEAVPSRPRRAVRAVGRFLIHEWTLATLGALALAVLMTWPTLRYPLYTLPQDYWDPSLQAWQMAWSGHILLANPAQLWQSNTFFPEQWSFAFSDTLLGYAPAGMLGTGPGAAILRYNIMFVLAHALATLGAYALARQLGSARMGAAVAGVTYAYAPWLLAQAGHLHVLSNGGIPLALAMLARGHGWSLRHGYRPERRHDGWVYAGWFVAAWQLSLGFGIGLPFAYFLGGTVVVALVTWFVRQTWIWPERRPFGRRMVTANVVGGLLFGGVGLLLAIPYFNVTELHPYAERSIGDIGIFSPPASGFVTAPAESRIWGGLHEGARAALPWHPEMTLLPGFVLYALAAGGLFFSVWRLRQRLLLLAGVVVTMVLAMGTRFFGGTWTYVPLFEHLPGWNGLRTPGRLMLWATLLLGLLAAGAITALTDRVRDLAAQRIPSWPGPWLRLATLLPLLLVTVEGLNSTPHPVVPSQPAAMRLVDGPMLVLPSNQSLDQHVMLWSTTHFQDVVNGGSGFTPRQLDDVRRVTQSFPDQTSVEYLRTLGVRNVVLLRDQLAGTPWEITVDSPVDFLGITREEIGDAVVYRLFADPSVGGGQPQPTPTGQPGGGLPTSLPSNLPSGLPTNLPSGLPTSLPTNLPTGLPTR
ncbi:PT repeat [Micromonospora krabiensis]|uniref:PT repeat n=1 Tax=Micromonospora krabiensis TaxID=307121 RepID=A0A1C3N8L5_9ACTN|nr:PT repeat [Micromonospora krabiensis]